MDSLDPRDAVSDEARVKYLPQDYDGDGKISERMKMELTNRKGSTKGSKLLPGQVRLDTAPDLVQVPICIYDRTWGRLIQVRRVPGSHLRKLPRSREGVPGADVSLPDWLSMPPGGIPPGNQVPGPSGTPGRHRAGRGWPRRVAKEFCFSTTPTRHLIQVMMALCQANPCVSGISMSASEPSR